MITDWLCIYCREYFNYQDLVKHTEALENNNYICVDKEKIIMNYINKHNITELDIDEIMKITGVNHNVIKRICNKLKWKRINGKKFKVEIKKKRFEDESTIAARQMAATFA